MADYIGTVAPVTGLAFQHTEFFDQFHHMVRSAERSIGGELFVPSVGRGPAGDIRNAVVMGAEGDWVLFLDTDQKYPDGFIEAMLASQQAIVDEHGTCSVLGGLVFTKTPPHLPCVFHYDANGDDWFPVIEIGCEAHPWDSPWMVDSIGGGFMLVQRDVFERILHKLGVAPYSAIGRVGNEKTGPKMQYRGADLAFARRCFELGIDTWCDPRIQAGHYAMRVVTVDDWLQYQPQVLDNPIAAIGRSRSL